MVKKRPTINLILIGLVFIFIFILNGFTKTYAANDRIFIIDYGDTGITGDNSIEYDTQFSIVQLVNDVEPRAFFEYMYVDMLESDFASLLFAPYVVAYSPENINFDFQDNNGVSIESNFNYYLALNFNIGITSRFGIDTLFNYYTDLGELLVIYFQRIGILSYAYNWSYISSNINNINYYVLISASYGEIGVFEFNYRRVQNDVILSNVYKVANVNFGSSGSGLRVDMGVAMKELNEIYKTYAEYIGGIEYKTGFSNGRAEGMQIGFEEGIDRGYDIGYNEGYIKGVQYGQDICDITIDNYESNLTKWVYSTIKACGSLLEIQIGDITLGAIVLIPISISFAWFIIKLFRGGKD